MKILYNNSEVKNGIFLTPSETITEPNIDYNLKSNALYTLIMHDPDAVGGNLIHWLVVNIDGNNIHNGDILLEYKGPSPPKGSGIHRYIFLLYEQTNKVNASISNRHISMDEVCKNLDNKLQLVSSLYFTSKNQNGGKKKKTRKRAKKSYKRLHKTRTRINI